MKVLLSFRNDEVHKSAKQSAINLYPFRREGHPPHSDMRTIRNEPHSETPPVIYHIEREGRVSFRNDGHTPVSFENEERG